MLLKPVGREHIYLPTQINYTIYNTKIQHYKCPQNSNIHRMPTTLYNYNLFILQNIGNKKQKNPKLTPSSNNRRLLHNNLRKYIKYTRIKLQDKR